MDCTPCLPVGPAMTPFLSTPQSSALCSHSNPRPQLPSLPFTSTSLMTPLSSRGNTEPICVQGEHMCTHWCICAQFTVGLGTRGQLMKPLSEESLSSANWGLPTVVSFLCYCPEIIQSTGFELQIREEEDDPWDGPVAYGAGAMQWKSRCMGTTSGQVK